jgi:hypothetical protein
MMVFERVGIFFKRILVNFKKLTIVMTEQGGTFTSVYPGLEGFVHRPIRALPVRVCVR